MNQENNPLLPYINRLSLECDIPLDFARSILGLALVLLPEAARALGEGRMAKVYSLSKTYQMAPVHAAMAFSFSTEKTNRALLMAAKMSGEILNNKEITRQALRKAADANPR